MKASVVMIVMKGPRASGYFGIGEVASLTQRADAALGRERHRGLLCSSVSLTESVCRHWDLKVSALTAAGSPVMFVSGATSCYSRSVQFVCRSCEG